MLRKVNKDGKKYESFVVHRKMRETTSLYKTKYFSITRYKSEVYVIDVTSYRLSSFTWNTVCCSSAISSVTWQEVTNIM